MSKKSRYFCLITIFLCLSATTTIWAGSSVLVSGRTYSPTCPGYFSNLLFDGELRYTLDPDLETTTRSIALVYSLRNQWTEKSWSLPIETMKMNSQDGRTWMAIFDALTVAERGHFHMSHLEFAIRRELADGRIEWDNGGRAPLGFYSAPIPLPTCGRGALSPLQIQPMASADDYPTEG